MPDWTDQVADQIENAVCTVREKTVVPAERLVAYIVAGLFILFLVLALAILAAVGLFRLIDVYLPSGSWATWLVFGGVFLLAGVLCLSFRRPS
jgi:predicted membrane channel-forming protein YqfA (hemolysin III family)